MEDKKNKNPFGPVIARAWEDEAFKQRLLQNPKEAVKEMGIDFPENRDLLVLEQPANAAYLIIPPKPSASELSDDVLDKVAGGVCTCQGSMYTMPNSGS